MYPLGLRKLLKWIDTRYSKDTTRPQILILENGMMVPDEDKLLIADAVKDKMRVGYYKTYIQNVMDSIQLDNVNVKGYFSWSLLDSFEWASGYSTKFGMIYVDFKNSQTRYLKDSAFWYSVFIKTADI